jgi:GNAT superfamily N-acetyltransferase
MVATEYGVANLSGKTIRERAQALIDIAHPDDRQSLIDRAKAKNILYRDQIFLPESARLYPDEIDREETFKNGVRVRFRAIRPSDENQMRRLFYRFSDEAVYTRYFSSIRSMPHARMQAYVNVDWSQVMSLVGLVGKPGQGRIIAEARYLRESIRPFAEVAFIVDEEYQSLGISTFLYKLLIDLAKERQLAGFTAEVLFSNISMMKVFKKGTLPVKANLENGVYHITIPFE